MAKAKRKIEDAVLNAAAIDKGKTCEMASRATNIVQQTGTKKMKQFIQNILHKSILLLALMLVGVGEVGAWNGSDPFNYYYLKNVSHGTSYVYFKGSKDNNNQWYGLTGDSNFKTEFIINRYNPSASEYPSIFSYSVISGGNTSYYWFGEVTGNTTREGTIYEWDVNTASTGFTLSKTTYEGTWPFGADKTRYFHAKSNVEIDVPKDVNDISTNTSYYWQLEPLQTNNSIFDYYLYNVGTEQFLIFHDDGKGEVKAFVTNTPAFASLISINKFSSTYIKTTIEGDDYYLYQDDGDNEERKNSEFFFTIIPKTTSDGTSGYLLQSKNDDYDRLAYASGDCPLVTYPRKANINGDDKKSLWRFISQDEVNNAPGKESPGLPHVHDSYDNINKVYHFTYTKSMFCDGMVTPRMDNGKWDDGGNRVWLTKEEDVFDIHFKGIPDNLSFSYKPKSNKDVYKDRYFSVYESANGDYWGESLLYDLHNSSSSVKSATIPLKQTTRYVRFCITGCNGLNENYDGGCFSDIVISEFHQFEASPKPLDFGKHGKDEGDFEDYIVFSHANSNGNITISIEDDDDDGYDDSSAFRLETTSLEAGQDTMRTDYVKVSYVANDVHTHNAKIVFRDKGGNNIETVIVQGERTNKSLPTFSWNPQNKPYLNNSSIQAVFTSTGDGDITPIVTPSSAGVGITKVGNSYTLNIGSASAQEYEITFSQEEGENYCAHTESYKIMPYSPSNLFVPFIVSGNDYDNNNDKTGTVNWISEDVNNQYLHLGNTNASTDFGNFVSVSLARGTSYTSFQFAGKPKTLSFKYRVNTTYASSVEWANTAETIGDLWNLISNPENLDNVAPPIWTVYEKANSEDDWTPIWTTKSRTTNFQYVEIPLQSTTRYIKLCYEGTYAGFYKDITITSDAFYIKNNAGKFLSRGGDGTQPVWDDYGFAFIPSRSYNSENPSQPFTQLQYVDNGEFVYFNGGSNLETSSAVQNIDIPSDWIFVTPEEHSKAIEELKDKQASTAVAEFQKASPETLSPFPSLAILRQQLRNNDYTWEPIFLTNNVDGVKQQYYESGWSDANPLPLFTSSEELSEGLYCLSLKAFNRISDNTTTYSAHLGSFDTGVAYVYVQIGDDISSKQCSPIGSVFDSFENFDYNPSTDLCDYNPLRGEYYPNGVVAAELAFAEPNRYNNDVFFYVPEGGASISYGVVSPSNGVCKNWLCWGEFTLYRYGRKEIIFDNGEDHDGDGNWSTGGNWYWVNNKTGQHEDVRGEVPREIHNATISKPVRVDINDASVLSVNIDSEGSISIAPTGGLTIGMGGIEGATSENLKIESTTDNCGYIKVSPEVDQEKMPTATVQYATKGTLDTGANKFATWQYFGTAVKSMESYNFGSQVWIYLWDEPSGWVKKVPTSTSLSLDPFAGYAISQYGHPTYEFKGQLINENKTITLTKTDVGMDGDNLFANSYAAPIDVKNFTSEDFSPFNQDTKDLEMVFYIFNSGSWNQWNDGNNAYGYDNSTAGQYLAIPALGVGLLDPGYEMSTIPPMQGVYVVAKNDGAQIKLNYKKHVWDSKKANLNAPMRAPQRDRSQSSSANDEMHNRVRIAVSSANSGGDYVYVIATEQNSSAYENGYDAKKIFSDAPIVGLYTNEPAGKLSVSVDNNLVGKYIGLKAGADSVYTFTFTSIVGEPLYLHDLVTDSLVLMTEGRQYTFSMQPDSVADFRFQIVEESSNSGNATSVENANSHQAFWMIGNTLYTDEKGRLYVYDASGRLVVTKFSVSGSSVDLSSLVKGVYVVKCGKEVTKIVVAP